MHAFMAQTVQTKVLSFFVVFKKMCSEKTDLKKVLLVFAAELIRFRCFRMLIVRDSSLSILQIEQIKAGKTIAQLPKISVPKPPPAPKFKIGQYTIPVPLTGPEKTTSLPAVPAVGVIGNRTQGANVMISTFFSF